MQTIYTKILPATDTLGCRVKVRCARGTRTYPRPDSEDGEALHRWAVARVLFEFATADAEDHEGTTPDQQYWGAFVSGQNEDGSYTHVLIGRGNAVARAGLEDAARQVLKFMDRPRNSADENDMCDVLKRALGMPVQEE